MQRSFDAMRVRSVYDLAGRIVAFRDATGRCPIGNLAVGETVTVLLTHQPPNHWPPEAPRLVSPAALAADLSAVEGGAPALPSDPQRVGFDFFPAIQYETDALGFILGVSLYHPHAHAAQRGPHWYKFDLRGDCSAGSGPARPIH